MERINQHIDYIIRTKERDYIYVRNPSVKKKNPAYYANKNLFPRALPPSSLTTFSQDKDIKDRMLSFIKTNLPQVRYDNVRVISLTKTYNQNGSGMTYHALVEDLDKPDSLMWFFVHSHLSPVF